MVHKHFLPIFISFSSFCIFIDFSATAWAFPDVTKQPAGMETDLQSFSDVTEYLQSDVFRDSGRRCGTRKLESAFLDQRLGKSTTDCTEALTNIQDEYFPTLVYTIPVWWHIIYRSDGVGNIPGSAIEAQIEVLNEDFRAMAETMGSNGFDVRIQFESAGITRTANNEWFTDSTADENAYKQALAKDPNSYLNIYTNDAGGYLGYAYFPHGSAGAYWDGIVLNYASVGGRNNGFYPYDQGRTLVHEMGHYLGLYHTFEDGADCGNTYSSGDRIVDTNAENTSHFGCSQTYSCNSLPDPIHNYMSYTDDSCMYRFTREQANRAVCSLLNYRPDLSSISGGGGGGGEGSGGGEAGDFPWSLFLQILTNSRQSRSL